MSIQVASGRVAITGNTYPVKDQIKAMGGRWNPDAKAWMVPAEVAAQAQALVAGASAAAPRQSGYACTSGYRPSKCRECGAVASRYNPIYRSGSCKSCWLSEKEERDMGY